MKRFSNVATLAALVALIFPPPARAEKNERDDRDAAAARLAHQPKRRPKSNKQLEAEAIKRRQARNLSR